MLIVQKFGGSSVANFRRINNVAKRIVESYKKGNDIVVVLSAQGNMTDDLIKKAKKINNKPSKRELDMLLSIGEQQSVSLMSMAIHKLGYPAISLNANQVKIESYGTYGNARIKNININRIKAELEKRNIVIITGFQGINNFGDITTLGRGGSDTTAVALAASLNSDLCEIYTDVEGIYTIDPRLVKKAIKLKEISYDEMLELSSMGAKVLHNRSVELAKKYNVNLVVRSSLTKEEGTIVKEKSIMEKMFVSGLAVDKDISQITIVGIKDMPGMAFKIFSLLAKENITVDIIIQSVGSTRLKDISFTVKRSDLENSLNVLEKNKDFLDYDSINHDNNLVKLSAVGAGMASNPGIASKMFEALFDIGVNIKMISTSEIKISVLIDEKDIEKAFETVHNKLIEENLAYDTRNNLLNI